MEQGALVKERDRTMTTHRPTGSVDVVLTAGESRPLRRPAQDIPFRMLLMGNFSGRESSPEGARRRPPITWRPLRVDRDNLQSIPGKLSATLEGPLLGENTPPITLRFTDLDDFHPDRLVPQIEPLQKLSDLRRRLTSPATFSAAVDEVHAWTQPRQPTETRSVAAAPHPGRQPSLTHQPAVSSTTYSNRLPRPCTILDLLNGSYFSAPSSGHTWSRKHIRWKKSWSHR